MRSGVSADYEGKTTLAAERDAARAKYGLSKVDRVQQAAIRAAQAEKKKLPKTEAEKVEILTSAGGNLWEKHGKRRIYFDRETILESAGVKIDYYNTGNVSSASIRGERISNAEARRILGAYQTVKLYYDLSDDRFHRSDPYGEMGDYVYMSDNFYRGLDKKIR